MAVKSNVRWIGFAQIVKASSQLVGMAVLARLLDKGDFGLMAMAWSLINFANLFRDLGVASAVIQIDRLSEGVKTAAHYASVALGFSIFLLLFVSAPLASEFMAAEKLEDVVLVLGLSFPLASLGATHLALLERSSEYRKIAIIEAGASVVSLILAIAFVLGGLGVVSLALQVAISSGLSSVAYRRASGWRSSVKYSSAALREIGEFGSKITIFNILNYVSRNCDALIIGRFLGATVLGGYSMAQKLMLFPLQSISFISNRALYPIMSRSQNDTSEVSALYFKSLRLVVALSAPLMVGLFVLRNEAVSVIFGNRWADVAALLLWLAPVGLLQSITATTGVVFMARGTTRRLIFLGALGAILQISSILIGVHGGIEAVVVSYFVANCINTLPCVTLTSRELNVRVSHFLSVLAPPLVSSLLMGLGVEIVRLHIASYFESVVVVLTISCLSGGVLYSAVSLLVQRGLVVDLRGSISR